MGDLSMTKKQHEIVDLLKKLNRYEVGTADEGGGYMYQYANKYEYGQWVQWDDIQEIIDGIGE